MCMVRLYTAFSHLGAPPWMLRLLVFALAVVRSQAGQLFALGVDIGARWRLLLLGVRSMRASIGSVVTLIPSGLGKRPARLGWIHATAMRCSMSMRIHLRS